MSGKYTVKSNTIRITVGLPKSRELILTARLEEEGTALPIEDLLVLPRDVRVSLAEHVIHLVRHTFEPELMREEDDG